MIEKVRLGRFQEIKNLRDIWPNEQVHFSAWLAQEENLAILGETLGLELHDAETEKSVGDFSCDIFCKEGEGESETQKSVLIENQLEQSNHDHLGKIITYASGLRAGIVIWIVTQARNEHASAIKWLNSHTDDEVSFFLVEIHAYRIGDSDPAPWFEIIEKPDDFEREVRAVTVANETESERLKFWLLFNDEIDRRGRPFNKRKATTQHWYNISVGSSRCHLTVQLVNKEKKVRLGVWIPDDKDLYDDLFQKKDEIEKDASQAFCWNRNDEKKASYISMEIPGLDFENQKNYGELINKIIDKVIVLKKVFERYIRSA